MHIDKSKRLYLRRYSVLERAEQQNKIVIWPELPFWIYINEICVELIRLINGKNLYELMEAARSRYGKEIDVLEVLELLDTLYAGAALYQEGEAQRFAAEGFSSYVIQNMTLNVSSACNLNCSHCYIGSSRSQRGFMTLDTARTAIDKISPYMIDSCRINVSGGEALLNEAVFDILRYFRHKGKGRLNLITNGTLITSEASKKLSEIEGLKVQVSLDGASKEVHESIRGVGTYEKTIAGINNLLEQGNTVYLAPMVTPHFFEELEEYFSLAKELGIKGTFLQPVNYMGRARLNRLKRVNSAEVFKRLVGLYERDPSLIGYISGTLEAMLMSNIKMLNRSTNCGAGMGTLAVYPNGDCFPCQKIMSELMYCGNIVKEDFYSIWIESPVLRLLREIRVERNMDRVCANCDFRHFCGGGCRGQALANTGDIYGMSCTCEPDRELLLELLWTAAQKPHIFQDEAMRQLQLNKQRERETIEVFDKIRFMESGE